MGTDMTSTSSLGDDKGAIAMVPQQPANATPAPTLPPRPPLEALASLSDRVHLPPSATFDAQGVRHGKTRAWMALVALTLLWISSQAPFYMFISISNHIVADIGGEDRWTWFIMAYWMASMAVSPLMGNFSDIASRRAVYMSGTTLVMLGMAVTSAAQSMNTFIAGMTLTGAGAGASEVATIFISSELAPRRMHGRTMALVLLGFLPFCPAAVWANLLATSFSWRICALLGVAMAAIATLASILLPEPSMSRRSCSRMIERAACCVDYLGAASSSFGLTLLLFGLRWGGDKHAWATAQVLAPIIVGLALLIVFVYWEAKFWAPMIPGRFLQLPWTFAAVMVLAFLSGAGSVPLLIFWPSQAYNVYGHDPAQVSIRGLPVPFGMLGGACAVLVLLSLTRGAARSLLLVAAICLTIGSGAMAITDADNLRDLWALLILAGLGIGGLTVPISVIAMLICPEDLRATMVGLTVALRSFGAALGYCIYQVVFVARFETNAREYIGGTMESEFGTTSPEPINRAIELTRASHLQPLQGMPGIAGNSTRFALLVAAGQTAYAASYQWMYLISIAFGAASILAVWGISGIGPLMKSPVPTHLERGV